ncbi:MAG TPA: OmpH family outer membrane protein [Bacteroidales bacterium]|nr:OmpH family outer membrane protein [Bacteroidales bacterium]HPI68010.1 OmpH family outer membrane protein [Bacteroidales bacterium]HPR72455.1 OmpH family outer membrane protein [Bacteroidales bacterium]
MKKLIIITGMLILTAAVATAQKYAFVDTEYIRRNIPAFETAQQQLDKLSEQWEKEIADGYAAIEQMYKSYQNEAPLLSQDMKIQREEAIINREKEIKELQNRYFGMEGELFKKREELVKPLQDEILKAIKDIAVEGSYAVIFDSASGGNILFANPKYDISDEVLERLGYNN